MKKYDKIRKEIEAMSPEQRIEKLDKMSTEIFIIANSFAGNETGSVAVCLHETVNSILLAQKIFKGEAEDEIPARLFMGSIGIPEQMIEMSTDKERSEENV